jgi:hypothetical protein
LHLRDRANIPVGLFSKSPPNQRTPIRTTGAFLKRPATASEIRNRSRPVITRPRASYDKLTFKPKTRRNCSFRVTIAKTTTYLRMRTCTQPGFRSAHAPTRRNAFTVQLGQQPHVQSPHGILLPRSNQPCTASEGPLEHNVSKKHLLTPSRIWCTRPYDLWHLRQRKDSQDHLFR